MKFLHKHTLCARIELELPYDPNDGGESYTKALQTVAAKRKLLIEAGAEITKDSGKPVVSRE